VTASAEYKFFGNWRQIISYKDIEYCSERNDPNSAITRIVEHDLPWIDYALHKCPYLVGPIGIYNYTDQYWVEMDKMDKKGEKLPASFRRNIFKGDMRAKVKLRTDDDPKVLDLLIAYTLSFRNADTF